MDQQPKLPRFVTVRKTLLPLSPQWPPVIALSVVSIVAECGVLIGVERRVITASLCNDARVAAGPEHTGRSPVRSRPGYKAAGSQRYDCQSADERAESHLTRDSQSAAAGHESRCNIFRCLLTVLTDIEIYFTYCAICAAVPFRMDTRPTRGPQFAAAGHKA